MGDVKFELHGYARMPLMTQGTREPYLVDNDYYLSGFAYTRLYEPDWSELFFSATKGKYKAEFGMFASLYSDYSQASIANQLGIAQASVHRAGLPRRRRASRSSSACSGIATATSSRTTRTCSAAPTRAARRSCTPCPAAARIQGGLGLHEANLQQNQGMTPIAHVGGDRIRSARSRSARTASARGPATSASSRRSRTARCTSPASTRAYKLPNELGTGVRSAFGYYHMDKVLYLAPALEVMHSTGGRGLTENFLGLDSSMDGTGHMYTLATDEKINITDKLLFRAFGMLTWVRSPQVDEMDPLKNRDRRLYIKWGFEPTYRVLPKLLVATRFDRVILDEYDSQNSFRVLSPKIGVPARQLGRDLRPVLALLVRQPRPAPPRPGAARDRARQQRVQAPGAGRLVIAGVLATLGPRRKPTQPSTRLPSVGSLADHAIGRELEQARVARVREAAGERGLRHAVLLARVDVVARVDLERVDVAVARGVGLGRLDLGDQTGVLAVR